MNNIKALHDCARDGAKLALSMIDKRSVAAMVSDDDGEIEGLIEEIDLIRLNLKRSISRIDSIQTMLFNQSYMHEEP